MFRHSRVGGNPCPPWTPACAEVTEKKTGWFAGMTEGQIRDLKATTLAQKLADRALVFSPFGPLPRAEAVFVFVAGIGAGIDQRLHHVALATGGCHHQGGVAIGIGAIGAKACLEASLHRLRVTAGGGGEEVFGSDFCICHDVFSCRAGDSTSRCIEMHGAEAGNVIAAERRCPRFKCVAARERQ